MKQVEVWRIMAWQRQRVEKKDLVEYKQNTVHNIIVTPSGLNTDEVSEIALRTMYKTTRTFDYTIRTIDFIGNAFDFSAR